MTTYDSWKTYDAASEEAYGMDDFTQEIESSPEFEVALTEADYYLLLEDGDTKTAQVVYENVLDEMIEDIRQENLNRSMGI